MPAHTFTRPRPPCALVRKRGPHSKHVTCSPGCCPAGICCWREDSARWALQSKMKRNHNYSSSDSDMDDNIEVEKDSGDENGYGNFISKVNH